MQVAYKERGGNPLKHFGFLLLGVISAILSLCWLIHIVLYIFIRQPAPASHRRCRGSSAAPESVPRAASKP